MVERVSNYLGRFDVRKAKKAQRVSSPLFFGKSAEEGIGHSPSQARFYLVTISSVLLAMHFLVAGTKGGFLAMFSAYALAAFARAFLSGMYVPSYPRGYTKC